VIAGRPVVFGQPYFFCPLQSGTPPAGSNEVRGSRDSLQSGASVDLSPSSFAGRTRDISPGIDKHASRESLLR